MKFAALVGLSAFLCFAQENNALVDRVGSTGFLQLEAPSFLAHSPSEQALGYWLTQASIAIDPIIYDQLSRYGLRQKKVLELIVSHPDGVNPAAYAKIVSFTKLFWACRGNHNDNTSRKFLPEFSFDELKDAGLVALKHGAHGFTEDAFVKEIEELKQSLFDAEFEPLMTNKNPQSGGDILQASSNNFYFGVSLADVNGFTEHNRLNSRVAKVDGRVVEQVYRAGTPDGKIPAGLYAEYLSKANSFLEKAAAVADPAQAKVIRELIRYYQTGDPKDWIRFGADWVQNNASVDFANGFIEIYRDARGAKGTSQSFVTITDNRMNSMMQKIAENAQYFEDRAPWTPEYRKQGVKPPLAKAVETLVETGDFHVSTIGDNLPNENEIHEKYGSKSFLFTGSSRALTSATGTAVLDEFAANAEEIRLGKKYDQEANGLLVAMHEIIGHGSGKLSPKLTHDAGYYLKQYTSTLEEARADLMALWNVWDPKLKELGLISSPDVGKAMYNGAIRVSITQLQRSRTGDTIQEDHERCRQLIANYVRETGAVVEVQRNGKTYLTLLDYDKMHTAVGQLLAELMRIKAEGDYDAIQALVDKYGVHFDPALRDQVVVRYQKLNIPTYWAGINADLHPSFDAQGKVTKVEISYPRDYVKQQLGYSAMYGN